MKTHLFLLMVLLALAPPLTGCVKVHTKVEPIDINVNVRLKVDRELNDFFGDLDAKNPTIKDSTGNTPSEEGAS